MTLSLIAAPDVGFLNRLKFGLTLRDAKPIETRRIIMAIKSWVRFILLISTLKSKYQSSNLKSNPKIQMTKIWVFDFETLFDI